MSAVVFCKENSNGVTVLEHMTFFFYSISVEGIVSIWDHYQSPPLLLRTLRNRHSSIPSPYPLHTDEESHKYRVTNIILEADMIVASVGTHVIGWRAGDRKSKDGKSGWKGQVVGKFGNGKVMPVKGFGEWI